MNWRQQCGRRNVLAAARRDRPQYPETSALVQEIAAASAEQNESVVQIGALWDN